MKVFPAPALAPRRARFLLGAAAALVLPLSAAAVAPAQGADAATSTVDVDPPSGAAADGRESVAITVTARDAGGLPLSGLFVSVASDCAQDRIAQPVAPTDAEGVAVATLATTVPGLRTIRASVGDSGQSLQIDQQATAEFVPAVRPNVIVVLMDDVGTDFLSLYDEVNPYQADLPYVHGEVGAGDVPANGEGTSNLYVNAPSLQALADEGVLFLNAYAMPLCSPSRACLYTGNYPVRTGVGNIVRADFLGGTLNEFGDPGFVFKTLPEVARTRNYADALFGKWHLGMPRPDMDPQNGSLIYRGWATIPERGRWSWWHCVFNNVDTPPTPPPQGTYYNFFYNRNHTTQAEVLDDPQGVVNEYATVVQIDDARAWCNAQSEPFLCVVPTNATHSPWGLYPPFNLLWTEEYVEGPLNAFSGLCAMLEALDSKIGDLWFGLDADLRARTTIILVGDNGTPRVCLLHARQSGQAGGVIGSGKDLGATYDFLIDAPTDRFKSSAYEKGTRVPLIVAGYGVENGGRVSDVLVNIVDVYPTVAELIGASSVEEVHGISFAPALRDEVDYFSHARDYSYSELFAPLGSTGPEVSFDLRRIGCSLIIPGQGRYKIEFDQALGQDELYKLQDAAGAFVDPFETENLPHGPGDAERANYLLVLAKLDEVVASGDGTGPIVCESAQNFCSSTPNSTGEAALLSVLESCSVVTNNFTLRAAPVPSQFGIFFYGLSQVNGGEGAPYGNGLRCVGGADPVYRLPIVSAVDNALQYTLDLAKPPVEDARITVGSTWHFQAWFRDPAGGGAGFDLSDAASATFGP